MAGVEDTLRDGTPCRNGRARGVVCHLAQSSVALSSGGQGQGGRCPLPCVFGRGAEDCEERMGLLAATSHSIPQSHSPRIPPLSPEPCWQHTLTPHTCTHLCNGFPTTSVERLTWTLSQSLLLIPVLKPSLPVTSLLAGLPSPAQLCTKGGMGTYPRSALGK